MNAGPARVLAALRQAGGAPCSGEALSNEHGVSRTQVWKHVQALRLRGYAIDAEPGDGYRLVGAPDRLYPEEIGPGLGTQWLAQKVHHFDEIDSTNREAFDLARNGAAHGTTIIAESQSAGRGRLGRQFYSPAHQNLYTSIVLRPEVTTAAAPGWILASAIAVADTIRDTVGDARAVEIKWPNDILLGGRKTSGILMELSGEAARVAFLILGIGINLNVDPSTFPGEFRQRATSVSSFLGAPVDRIAFTQRLFENLEPILDSCARSGLAGILPRFESHFHMAGQTVHIRDMDGSTRGGTVVGIDELGALRLAPAGGGPEQRVVAGDVTLEKESP